MGLVQTKRYNVTFSRRAVATILVEAVGDMNNEGGWEEVDDGESLMVEGGR